MPAPASVPPLQLKAPFAVRLSAPVRVPPESVNGLANATPVPTVSTFSVPLLMETVPVAAKPKLPSTLTVPADIASAPAPLMFELGFRLRVPPLNCRVAPDATA